VVPGGGARTSDPCDILRRVRAEVPDISSRYGIRELRPRRTATGDFIFEIPGAEASRKADELAALLRKHAKDVPGVRVVRPVRRVEFRVVGLDPSLTTEDVAKAIIGFAPECDAEEIRVGTIRESRGRCGSAWVQAPAIAGVPAAEAGTIKVGWSSARVVLLKGRPLRCYRYLAPGHAQRRCPCPVDRSRCCFNCGREGHTAAGCRAKPFCPPCEERGRKASHRSGGVGCTPVRASWLAREKRPPRPPAVRGACSRTAGATGVQRVEDGSGRPSSADTVVIPAGGGDPDASLGSSPRSPPGKKTRVAAEPSATPQVGEEPKPQREPGRRPDRPAQSSPDDKVEDYMDTGSGWEQEAVHAPRPPGPVLEVNRGRVMYPGSAPYRGSRAKPAPSRCDRKDASRDVRVTS